MNGDPALNVVFYSTDSGREPVRQWLKNLEKTDRKTIGGDIQFVQYGWPLGMPYVRKIENLLWEVRSSITGGRVARVLFTIGGNEMILLHGFIKKSQKISQKDVNLARDRRNQWHSGRS